MKLTRAESVQLALEKGPTYSDFEVHHLLSERTHLIVEAKAVFSSHLGREYRVQLPLLGILHDDFPIGAHNAVVDIEGATRLYLHKHGVFSSTDTTTHEIFCE